MDLLKLEKKQLPFSGHPLDGISSLRTSARGFYKCRGGKRIKENINFF